MGFFGELGHDLARAPEKLVNWIPHTTAAEKRAGMAATKAQIDLYTEQKNQLVSQSASLEAQKNVERSRITEKSIRARRTASRGGSSYTAAPATGISDTLG